MTSAPRIAILIVNWNAHDPLARCLASLAALPFPSIVVDNASSDGSAEMVARRFPRVRLVRETTNLGFAGGVNRARREAAALDAIASASASDGDRDGGDGAGDGPVDRLLLLNPDTIATREAIEALSAALDRNTDDTAGVDQSIAPGARAGAGAAAGADARPAIAAVGGRLVSPDGTPQAGFNVRRFPTLASIAMDLLLIDQLWPGNPATRRYLARDLPDDRAADVDQPAAACLMIRASAFDAVGGMDERFHPAWFEDVDLCRRLGAAGFRIRYEPTATFVHQGGVAMRTLGLGRFSSIWYANMERYARKHHGVAGWLLVKLLIAAGMVARALVSVVRGDGAAAGAYARVLGQTLTRWRVR